MQNVHISQKMCGGGYLLLYIPIKFIIMRPYPLIFSCRTNAFLVKYKRLFLATRKGFGGKLTQLRMKKEKKFMHKNLLKRGIALLLTLAMVFSMVIPVGAVNEIAPAANGVSVTEIDFKPAHSDAAKLDNLSTAQLPEGIVRVSIILERESTLEHGFATYGIARNNDALMYRDMLAYEQEVLEQDIESMALNGADLDVVWNLTLAANIISANVDASKIEAIKAVPGVKDVVLETRYEPAVIDSNLPNDPNMATSSAQIGSTNAWAAGYTGAGSKVAIIDTGIDDDHELFQPEAFEYSYDKQGLDKSVLLTQNDVIDLYDKLNISKYGDLDSSKLYLNSKVPFAYNYVDRDLDINHDNDTQGEHGSHVTGIAAANSYVKKNGEFVPSLEEVHTQGVAPDAQVVTMKVFGKKGGAYDSDYMVAIEDAIVLGCDSVNLSLGSSMAGFSNNYEYAAILNKLAESDTVVVMSAGNNGAWADESNIGGLYGDDVNFHTGGSPGSYTNTLAVASVDNAGSTGNYFKIGDTIVFYTETSGYGNPALTTLAEGNYDFVYVDGVGTDEQFAEVDVEGKVALCNRGSTSFFEKANAAAAAGAAAVIVVNNQPGTISMNLEGYKGKVPVVSITLADGQLFKTTQSGEISDGSKVYTGTYTSVGNKVGSTEPNVSDDGTYTMSDFSSWGVPGTLEMKPEITAPGGNIYSVNGLIPGGQGYENMSGTSMAAPQITGMAAVLGQYIREEGLAAKTGYTPRQLINSLLMSTSVPVREADNDGNYYSILKQGSGLANVGAAASADSVIMMAEGTNKGATDGKVKVELGEDVAKVGAYDYSFTITNISDRDNAYKLSSEFFTQDLYMGAYLDTYTVPVAVTNETYTVNGKPVEYREFNADVDMNGITNAKDADAILAYVVGNIDASKINTTVADVNGDGDITSYDAALLLEQLEQWLDSQVTVRKGETVTVGVHVEIDKAALDAYPNGAYVEGFTTLSPVTTSEGEMDVTYTIPVLGFYGNWSDASMFDRLNYQEYLEVAKGYKDDFDIYPYVAPYNTIVYHDADANDDYVDTINPYNTLFDEWDGHTERRAIRSKDGLTSYQYTLIRNAGAIAVVIKDANGNVLDVTTPKTQEFAAFYYASQGKWMYDNGTVNIGTKVADLGLAEGDKFTVELVAIPELYTAPVADDSGNVSVEAFVSLLDKIGNGAVISTTYTIDDTLPKLLGTMRSEEDGSLTVTMQDNQYVAGVLIYTADGSTLFTGYLADQDAEGGVASTVIPGDDLDLLPLLNMFYGDGNPTNDMIMSIFDYAGNTKSFKVSLDNGTVGEVKPTAIDIPDEVRAPLGGTSQITLTIEPSLIKSVDVVWEVGDPTIASVSDGVVTGLALGETTVTVTAVENPALTDTAVLKVVEAPSQVLSGLVYNSDSKANWSTFNTSNPANFTEIADGAYYYAGSTDSSFETLYTHDGSTIYRVSAAEGYAATPLFDMNPVYLFPDAAPNLYFEHYVAGETTLVGAKASSDVLTLFLPESAGIYTAPLDDLLGGSPIAAIAYVGTNHNYGRDYYYLLLENGDLWWIYLDYQGNLDGDYIGNIGLNLKGAGAADGSSYASMIYSFDNETETSEYLYVASYTENDPTNTAYINVIGIDYETGFVGSIGRFSFGDNVWPAVALYEPISAEGEEVSPARVGKLDGVGTLNAQFVYEGSAKLYPDAAPIEPAAPVEPVAPEFTEPTEPVVPAEPEAPVESAEPTEPVAPVESDEPVQPEIVGSLNAVSAARTVSRPYAAEADEPAKESGSPISLDTQTEGNVVHGVNTEDNTFTITATVVDEIKNFVTTIEYDPELFTFDSMLTDLPHCAYNASEPGKIVIAAASDKSLTDLIAEPVFTYAEEAEEKVIESVVEDGAVSSTTGEYGPERPEKPIVNEVTVDHVWDDGKVTTPATCEKEGVKTYTCADCGHTKTEAIKAAGHAPVYVAGAQASCVSTGLVEHWHCDVCGKNFADQECKSEMADVVIPKNANNHHIRLSGWIFNPDSHWTVCAACRRPMNFGPHIYNNGACVVCGYAQADIIPVVPDVPMDVETITVDTPTEAGDNSEEVEGDNVNVNDAETKPQPEKNPGTGLTLAVVPMLAAAAAAVVFKRR